MTSELFDKKAVSALAPQTSRLAVQNYPTQNEHEIIRVSNAK